MERKQLVLFQAQSDNLSHPFDHGGRWPRPAVKQLADEGLIQSIDARNSRH